MNPKLSSLSGGVTVTVSGRTSAPAVTYSRYTADVEARSSLRPHRRHVCCCLSCCRLCSVTDTLMGTGCCAVACWPPKREPATSLSSASHGAARAVAQFTYVRGTLWYICVYYYCVCVCWTVHQPTAAMCGLSNVAVQEVLLPGCATGPTLGWRHHHYHQRQQHRRQRHHAGLLLSAYRLPLSLKRQLRYAPKLLLCCDRNKCV